MEKVNGQMKRFDMMNMNSSFQLLKPIQDKISIVADLDKSKRKKEGKRISKKEVIVKEQELLKLRNLKNKCWLTIKVQVYLQ